MSLPTKESHMDFAIGQTVRSYDFPDSPNRAKFYVEGTFQGFGSGRFEGRYAIRVNKVVRDGEIYMDEAAVRATEQDVGAEYIVYPPKNGLPDFMGGVTNGVEAA